MIEKTQGRLVRAGGVSRVGANSSKAKERFRFLKSSERVGLGKGLGEERARRRGGRVAERETGRGEVQGEVVAGRD